MLYKGKAVEEQLELAEVLNKQLGLSPYESRAYVSLVVYGPMSPSSLAQKASVPRPRAYDVLRSLTEKGLLVEQSGKPSIYAVVEPAQGVKNLLISFEMESLRQLEERRKAVQALTEMITQMYERSKGLRLERSKVWFTRRDTAFIAIYSEALRNCRKEVSVATTDPRIPEEKILEAVEFALKKGVSIRVAREVSDSWALDELHRYEGVVESGSQVRYLPISEIPLRFTIFDKKDTIIVLSSTTSTRPQSIEALWVRMPALAKILCEHFEELWRKGKPILPIIKEIEQKKQVRLSSQQKK